MKALLQYTLVKQCKDHIANKYQLANGLKQIDFLDLLPDFKEEIDNYSFLDGTSRISDIALLRSLARRFPDGRYLEIGTWRGESLSNIAPLMKEVISLSFDEADMRKVGMPETAIKASRFFSKNISNHTGILHNSQTYDFSALEKTCDLIFVDADHKYPGVTIDTRNAFKLLRDKQAIIVWHDYGKSLEEINWEVFRGILDGAPSDEHRKNIFHVSNTLCAIYLHNPPATFRTSEKFVPNKKFSLTISGSRI
ncbi:MAG: class I SAM-dependent methyltransferase [Bacteroidia bacterium]